MDNSERLSTPEDIFHLGIKAIIRNEEGKILLLQVNPEKLEGQVNSYWDIPGGRIHKGDSPETTLRREVEEETGIKEIKRIEMFAAALSNIRIPQNNDSVGLILFSYLCDVDKINQIQISEEHQNHAWFSPQEASELLKNKYPPYFVLKIRELD